MFPKSNSYTPLLLLATFMSKEPNLVSITVTVYGFTNRADMLRMMRKSMFTEENGDRYMYVLVNNI